MAGVNHLLKKPQQSTRLGSVKSVCKRDGFIEPFSIEKLEGWAEWACARHANTDWNLVIRNALRYVAKEQIHTDELQELLIKSAIALVNTQPEYDLVARDLYLARLRKQVYDSFDPPSLRGWHDILVRLGTWQDMSIYLTEEDWERLENAIDHERDFRFSYAGIKQFADKYLRRNDMTDELYETPQFTYMGMAMSMLEAEDWSIDEVIELYDAMSLHKLNIPTPLLVGLRSTDRGFASCCLMEAGDSLDSIDAAEHIIFKMVAARAGIGYLPRTRSVGDPIRGGAFMSTGKLPYIRHALSSTQANTQQSRGGSMTANIPYFDPEIMDIISAKSQRSAAEKRLDKSDFAIQINRMLLKRALKGESITLMSLYYAPELYNEFVNPNGTPESFEKVYSEAEARLKGKKRQGKGGKLVPLCQTLPAIDILEHIVTVRMETGRLYIQLMDNTNSHSNFDEPIKMSNLCVEINQPTYAFNHVVDLYKTPAELHNAEPGDIGEVSLCNLGAFTLGNFDDSEWERLAYLLLKMIDTVIEIQDYAFPTMEFTAKARRNVGIGLMNVAGAMAKDGLQFVGVEARNWIHRKMENHAYWLHKASVRLAKERGAATWAKHALPMKHGRLVVDTYNKSVDELVTEPLHLDWEGLRAEIGKHGMRNSVLSAQMPGESSSVVQGVTNSINPIREIVTYKRSGVNIVPQVAYGVTDGQGLEDIYTFAFDLDMEEWIKFVAVIQKFMNQSISADLWYRYTDYENERIPNSVVIRHIMLAMKYGWKSMYYAWFDVDNGGSVHTQAQGCDSGACSI